MVIDLIKASAEPLITSAQLWLETFVDLAEDKIFDCRDQVGFFPWERLGKLKDLNAYLSLFGR